MLDALRVALAVVVPLLTVALGLVVWLILGRALRPVEELRRGAALVASSGGPGSLPVPARDDELGALARTLNSMLDRLEAGAARQRAFVADAAHELRSPLAALRDQHRGRAGAPGVLRHGRARRRPRGRGAADAGAGRRPAAARAGGLDAAGARGARPRRGRARRGAADASRVTVTGDRARAAGDAAAVGRVLRNLVDNAVRHAGSRVVVTVADGSVRVDDDGAGLDPADRERVFERFVRLDEARQRDAGGSGLGLAIAREIAREQGGDVVLGVADLGGLRAELRLPGADGGPGRRRFVVATSPGGDDDARARPGARRGPVPRASATRRASDAERASPPRRRRGRMENRHRGSTSSSTRRSPAASSTTCRWPASRSPGIARARPGLVAQGADRAGADLGRAAGGDPAAQGRRGAATSGWTRCATRTTCARRVDEFNARIVSARRQLMGGPPVVTPLRDVEREVAAWRARRTRARSPSRRRSPRGSAAGGAGADGQARSSSAGRIVVGIANASEIGDDAAGEEPRRPSRRR